MGDEPADHHATMLMLRNPFPFGAGLNLEEKQAPPQVAVKINYA
jgi:hypothetical protein